VVPTNINLRITSSDWVYCTAQREYFWHPTLLGCIPRRVYQNNFSTRVWSRSRLWQKTSQREDMGGLMAPYNLSTSDGEALMLVLMYSRDGPLHTYQPACKYLAPQVPNKDRLWRSGAWGEIPRSVIIFVPILLSCPTSPFRIANRCCNDSSDSWLSLSLLRASAEASVESKVESRE
jgi:hypothetical protein